MKTRGYLTGYLRVQSETIEYDREQHELKRSHERSMGRFGLLLPRARSRRASAVANLTAARTCCAISSAARLAPSMAWSSHSASSSA